MTLAFGHAYTDPRTLPTLRAKLMPMGSRKRVGVEAAAGEETKLAGQAHTEASEERRPWRESLAAQEMA
jgi:hypothetical protein